MSIIKKLLFSLLIIGLMLITNSCWSSIEFDSLALVKGIGIDLTKKNERIKFITQISSPKSSQNDKKSQSVVVNTATGYTMFEANRNLVKILGRQPFYPHTEVIIFGEQIARKGLMPYIDFLNRDPEIRSRSYILIARGEAEKILKASHDLESIPAAAMEQIIDGKVISGTVFSNNLLQFTNSLLSPTKAPVTAPVGLKDEKIYIEGAAMFKKDKLVGWLSRKESRGLNFVLNPSEIKGPIIIKSPLNKKRITVELIEVKSKLKPQLKNGDFRMKVEIKAEGNIAETLTTKYKISIKKNIKQLNKLLAQVIKNEIINALHKSQKYQTDIFGFGEEINKKYCKEFQQKKNNWDYIYANLPVDIEVNAKIRRYGMIEEGLGNYK